MTKMKQKITPQEELDREVDKKCAGEIEKVLKDNSRALQPFIERTEFAEVARVRLARITPKGDLPMKENGD